MPIYDERITKSVMIRPTKWIAFSVLLLTEFHGFADPGPTTASLQAAAQYSRERRGFSFLVLRDGRVLTEDYANGGSPSSTHKIYSGTKSFWSVAAMCAVADGLITLDERVADTITEWRGDARRERITMRQLLNFTDGIDPANHTHSDELRDRNSYALHAPVVAAPGAAFLYGPSHLQIFCEVLRRKLHRQTPFEYLRRKVLNPIGIGAVEYKKDPLGNPLMASGFKLTARQWAKFGELVLHHGEYNGRAVVPGNLLGQCFRGTTANPAFGMGFWNNMQASRSGAREFDVENMLELKWHQQNWGNACICRSAPSDMIVSLGSGYQRLFVIPSLDLVIVRQGLDAKFSDGEFLRIILGH